MNEVQLSDHDQGDCQACGQVAFNQINALQVESKDYGAEDYPNHKPIVHEVRYCFSCFLAKAMEATIIGEGVKKNE